MSTALLIVVLAIAVIGVNVAVFAVLVRRSGGRAEPRAAVYGERSYSAAIDGYASVLLLRVLVQICRVVGAQRGCVLVRDPRRPDELVPVATHGLNEGVIGRRIESGNAWAFQLVGAAGEPIDTRNGVAVTLVRDTIGDCGYIWVAAGPGERPSNRRRRLLGELAAALERALDDIDDAPHLDELIGRALALVCADDESGPAADYAALCRAVGERLGLDAPALIELDLAARVQHAVAAAPAAAVRSLPGFEAVGIVLRFAGERWDGNGPNGLRGERIPLGSRILAVCDGLRAQSDAALRSIQAASGRLYDPDVVAAVSIVLLGPMPELGKPARHWADGDRLFDVVGGW